MRKETGVVETRADLESSRYFGYLRTLADLSKMANFMALQVYIHLIKLTEPDKVKIIDYNVVFYSSIFYYLHFF